MTSEMRRRPLPACKSKPALAAFFHAAMALVLVTPLTFAGGQAAAQVAHPSQDDVEAAYLYNFGKFVRWPADEQHEPLTICVLGKDPFGPTLDHVVAKESIDGRPLAVARVSDTSAVRACSILFISGSEAPRFDRDLALVAGLPIMTVSDMPDFVDHGGMIQFLLQDDRVRFEVNLNAASKSGLVLSSQLLKVAEHVVGNAPEAVAR